MGQGMSSGGSMPAPNGGYGAQNSFNGGQLNSALGSGSYGGFGQAGFAPFSSDPSIPQGNATGGLSGSYGGGQAAQAGGYGGNGMSGKGGSQSMGAPNSAYGQSQGNQWAPGMWGQSANQGLIPGLGAYQFAGPSYGGPGWNAPNIQGGPLPGQGGSTPPPGTTPPSNIDNTLPGSGAVRNERGTVTNPPGGTFTPGLPNVVPAGATGSPVVPMPGIQPGNVGPPGFNTGTPPPAPTTTTPPPTTSVGGAANNLASVPKSAVQGATAGTTALPQGTPAAPGMYPAVSARTGFGSDFTMQGTSPVIQNFNALMSQYGPSAAFNYMNNNFNAADWQGALKAKYGTDGMNSIINKYGVGGSGYSPITRNPDGSFRYSVGGKQQQFALPYATGGGITAPRSYWGG
jgi:hypothetical protein